MGAAGALTKVPVNAGASGSIGINGAVITTTGASGQSFTALTTNYTSALTLTAGSGPIAFVGGLNYQKKYLRTDIFRLNLQGPKGFWCSKLLSRPGRLNHIRQRMDLL